MCVFDNQFKKMIDILHYLNAIGVWLVVLLGLAGGWSLRRDL